MKDEEIIEVCRRRVGSGFATAVRWRLERGGGSGAIACCADAERAHEQERKDSREDSPGCAGVGEAVARWLEDRAAKHRAAAEKEEQAGGADETMIDGHLGAAVSLEICAADLRDPKRSPLKPDSEARNERSGRRNSPDQGA